MSERVRVRWPNNRVNELNKNIAEKIAAKDGLVILGPAPVEVDQPKKTGGKPGGKPSGTTLKVPNTPPNDPPTE